MNWRIYYDDGSTFDNEMGAPLDAPSFGVQVIVVKDEAVGRAIIHGFDWYFYNEKESAWYGADIHGLLDHFLHRAPEIIKVLEGRSLPTVRAFSGVLNRAITDPDFPKKSGLLPKGFETP